MSYPLTADQANALKTQMRTIPDFPKAGIKFKDLSTLLLDHATMDLIYRSLSAKCATLKPDYLAILDARGFLLGTPVAHMLGIGTVMIRKKGKLPGDVEEVTYDLEYGTDTLAVQKDLLPAGSRVVIIDDLLATAGTAGAAVTLLTKVGATVVGAGFLSELLFLDGRKKFDASVDVFALIQFDADMT